MISLQHRGTSSRRRPPWSEEVSLSAVIKHLPLAQTDTSVESPPVFNRYTQAVAVHEILQDRFRVWTPNISTSGKAEAISYLKLKSQFGT